MRINVADEPPRRTRAARLRAAGAIDADRGIEFFHIATDDAWVRDHGPLFVVRDGPDGARERAAVDFGFDAWGGKYPPWDRDDAVPGQMARALAMRCFEAGFVLEGGSIDGDGRGTVLTTETCLLDARREGGRHRSRAQMEERLARTLGAREVVWLGDGIAGDDTDGHVDDITRFVGPGTIVTAVADSASDRNARPLAENLARLRAMSDQDGRPFDVVELPMPPEQRVNGHVCPASHANFYIANGVVLVPTFGGATDARAIAMLAECLPGREVVGIPSARSRRRARCGPLPHPAGARVALDLIGPARSFVAASAARSIPWNRVAGDR